VTSYGANYAQGRNILAELAARADVASVTCISRRPAPKPELIDAKPDAAAAESKVQSVVLESSAWPEHIKSTKPSPDIFITALGTTRAAAGSLEQQRTVDVDLNSSAASAAAGAGVRVCVVVSSAGADDASRIPYWHMKGELDTAVQKMGFDNVVVLRPGLIVGSRSERSTGQYLVGALAGMMGSLHPRLKDSWAQDAGVIARAAVVAGLMAAEGKAPTKVWIMGQDEIVRLGSRARA
jgi:hypothetical protein